MTRRRAGGLAGISLVATSGLMGAYLGNPRLPRAYAAANCEVTTNADSGAGSLRQALLDFDTDPANCSVITFQEGLGTITLASDLPTVRPSAPASLTITGNGAAETVIDGDDGAHRGLQFVPTSGDLQVLLSDLTLTRMGEPDDGGAIYATFGVDLQISSVTFSGNRGYYRGGAIFLDGDNGSSLTITDSTFQGNYAQYSAAAVFSSGPTTVSGSTFSGNYTDDGSDEYYDGGSAIYAYDGVDLVVTDSMFSSNTSATYGGAIWADGAVTVTGSTFTGNEAAGEEGGAIYVRDGFLTVSESSFTGNTSRGDGGAVYLNEGSTALSVTDSTFSGNESRFDTGGAVRVRGSSTSVTITGSTFDDNAAPNSGEKGGAVASNSTVTITNSTFTGNTAGGGGGGLYLGDGGTVDFSTVVGNTGSPVGGIYGGGSLTITNSIVSGNSVDDVGVDGELTMYDTFLTSADSFSASTEPVTARLLFGDPLLGALADNGGPTLTMLPGAGSPVIGMADPAGAPATDQRGYARVVDGKADMGSVQATAVAPEPDLSQVPPSWHQASGRTGPEVPCPDGTAPSWDIWPNDGTGGWTCEWTTWWDVTKGTSGGWVTSPGYRATGKARHVFRYHAAG